jgi:hypothetical protein
VRHDRFGKQGYHLRSNSLHIGRLPAQFLVLSKQQPLFTDQLLNPPLCVCFGHVFFLSG